MLYTQEGLEKLSRKELQSLAKNLSIKANQASAVIIQEILQSLSVSNGSNDCDNGNIDEDDQESITKQSSKIQSMVVSPIKTSRTSRQSFPSKIVDEGHTYFDEIIESVEDKPFSARKSNNGSLTKQSLSNATEDHIEVSNRKQASPFFRGTSSGREDFNERKKSHSNSEVEAVEQTVNVPHEMQYNIGDNVLALMAEEWVEVEIIKMNKKTVRIMNRKTGWSSSLRVDLIRPLNSSLPSSAKDSNDESDNEIIIEAPWAAKKPSIVANDQLKTSNPAEEAHALDVSKEGKKNYAHGQTMSKAPARDAQLAMNKSQGQAAYKSSRNTVVIKRKSLSSTPIITPKATKAQLARQEAILRKMRGEPAPTPITLPVVPTPIVTNRDPVLFAVGTKSATATHKKVSIQVSNHQRYSKPTESSMRRTSATTVSTPHSTKPSGLTLEKEKTPSMQSARKTITHLPDFAKAHQKHFEQSKPITHIVKRDQNLNEKISSVYSEASQHGFIEQNVRNKFDRPQSISRTSLSMNEPSASFTPFKARPMPDFSSIHKSAQKRSSIEANKPEISNISKSFITITKPSRLVKDTGIPVAVKKETKRQEIQQNAKNNRRALLDAKRLQPVEPTQDENTAPSNENVNTRNRRVKHVTIKENTNDFMYDEAKIYAETGTNVAPRRMSEY